MTMRAGLAAPCLRSLLSAFTPGDEHSPQTLQEGPGPERVEGLGAGEGWSNSSWTQSGSYANNPQLNRGR